MIQNRNFLRNARASVLAIAVVSFAPMAIGATGWQATYSGDLNGSVKGGIVVPGGTSMVSMVRGASMSKDMKSKGNAALSVQVMSLPGQAPSLKKFDLTLTDGTTCRLKPDGSEKADLRDSSSKSYDISLSGTLECDGGKIISAQASAKK